MLQVPQLIRPALPLPACRAAGAISEGEVKAQIWALLLGGIGVAFALDQWAGGGCVGVECFTPQGWGKWRVGKFPNSDRPCPAALRDGLSRTQGRDFTPTCCVPAPPGHEWPVMTVLAVFGSFISYIYSGEKGGRQERGRRREAHDAVGSGGRGGLAGDKLPWLGCRVLGRRAAAAAPATMTAALQLQLSHRSALSRWMQRRR